MRAQSKKSYGLNYDKLTEHQSEVLQMLKRRFKNGKEFRSDDIWGVGRRSWILEVLYKKGYLNKRIEGDYTIELVSIYSIKEDKS